MMNVQEIIKRLNQKSPDDSRLFFWNRIYNLICNKNYNATLNLLHSHWGDDDYDEQVVAVCRSIVEMADGTFQYL